MSIDSKALRLAETSHMLDEMAAYAFALGAGEMGARVLAQADRCMDAALDMPLVED